MRSIRWISATLLALGAMSCVATAEGFLGMASVPGGYDLAAFMAPPCQAPAYGTYGNVVPGTYDCPSCCLKVWDGFCDKKAMRYEKWSNKNCGVCTGETPCVKSRCATANGCNSCVSPNPVAPEASTAVPTTAPVIEQPAPPSPRPPMPPKS